MRKQSSLYAILFLLVLMPFKAHAQGLIPETYVAIDLAVRNITLDGMAERLVLLNGGSFTPEQEIAMALSNQEQADQTYRVYGTNSAAHALYGSRHAKEIESWLAANPDWELNYDILEERFESLSVQLNAS